MYGNKLVIAIKSNGKSLREEGDSVFLPYLSEYCIFIKNLHSTSVAIGVKIDGEDVLNGRRIVIQAGSSMELERFYKDNNKSSGRKFKFIEKTKSISDYRGDNIEDGLVVISYQFEKSLQTIRNIYSRTSDLGKINKKSFYSLNSMSCSTDGISRSLGLDGVKCSSLDKGITVEGSRSDQEFEAGYLNEMEYEKHSMVIKLVGVDIHNNNIKYITPAKTKKICPTCGKKNKFSSDYCSRCGTFIS